VAAMKPPIFVHSLSDTEKEQLQAAPRSSEAFVMRRAQLIRLCRSLGETVLALPERRRGCLQAASILALNMANLPRGVTQLGGYAGKRHHITWFRSRKGPPDSPPQGATGGTAS
jgi:hypothetical protein